MKQSVHNMKKKGSILVVDDNRSVLIALQLLLKPHFEEIRTLASPNRLPAALQEREWDVLLLDMNFTSDINNGNEGLFWLHEAKRLCPAMPVVLFTAYADIALAVRGMKEGAHDFVTKPWDNQQLTNTLLSAARKGGSPQKPAPHPMERGMYWGKSPEMLRLKQLVEKVAATDANVLITGENGTGKEMLAREIHALSPRCRREMVCVDMGAVTESLFESELFGHAKGAFTDAHADRPGKFEAADGGTLFLDEIGNLPYHQQAKLLTAIQRRSIVRVGTNTPVPVDIRLICATNRDLDGMVAQGLFREDLLYRINTIHLEIPPLRQRVEDIVPLAEMFMARFCKQYGKPLPCLDGEAKQRLEKHAWKGNIRELEHAMEKAAIFCEGPTLTAAQFPFPRHGDDNRQEEGTTLEHMECQAIRKALAECNGNLTATASRLGITRQTLYNKMKKYSL